MLGKAAGVIKEADVVLEVVDARFPEETRSRELEKYAKKRGKKLIIVLNKCDLVKKSWCEEWKRRFEAEGIPCVYISAKKRLGTRKLRKKIKEVCEKRPIVACVVGYPNVGKSSVINVLVGKGVAPTGGRAGVTRGSQLVRISRNLYIIDSPGILPPKDKVLSILLGLRNPEGEAAEIAGEILAKSMGISLEEYAKDRGFLLKGGEPDIHRAAIHLIKRFLSTSGQD